MSGIFAVLIYIHLICIEKNPFFLSKYDVDLLVIVYLPRIDHSFPSCFSCASNTVIDLSWTEDKNLRIYMKVEHFYYYICNYQPHREPIYE